MLMSLNSTSSALHRRSLFDFPFEFPTGIIVSLSTGGHLASSGHLTSYMCIMGGAEIWEVVQQVQNSYSLTVSLAHAPHLLGCSAQRV